MPWLGAGSVVGLPELDEPGWTSDDFIRDFPVDFTLVLENVGDPDHGGTTALLSSQTPCNALRRPTAETTPCNHRWLLSSPCSMSGARACALRG